MFNSLLGAFEHALNDIDSNTYYVHLKIFTLFNFTFTSSYYSLPSIMLNLGSGSKLTFIEVLTINNYKFTILSNIEILTFIHISNCEESL